MMKGTRVAPRRNAVAIFLSSREKDRWISNPDTSIRRMSPKLEIRERSLPSEGKAPKTQF